MATRDIYFSEPLIEMEFLQRLLVRLIISIWNVVLAVSALIFILSPQKFIFWIGFLLVLYFLDRFVHSGTAPRSIIDLQPGARVNIAQYLSPKSRAILIAAHDKALIIHGNLYICLLGVILKEDDAAKILERMGVPLSELRSTVKVESNRIEGISSKTINENLRTIITESFNVAVGSGSRVISSTDILGALGRVNDLELANIFDLFNMDKNKLGHA